MIALLVDVGNSRIKWRMVNIGPATHPQWQGGEQALALQDHQELQRTWRSSTSQSIDALLISNVARVDLGDAVVGHALRAWPDATVHRLQSESSRCGVVNGYREPGRLGVDRWLAMIGARALRPDRHVLVCSFGTATTIDLLVGRSSTTADFVGGVILPGFETMRSALSSNTARLPMAPGTVVAFADNTGDAIASGVAAAQLGAVERGLANARKRVGETGVVSCLLAGGGAATVFGLLGPSTGDCEVMHDLVLRGMAVVAADLASTGALHITSDPQCARSS